MKEDYEIGDVNRSYNQFEKETPELKQLKEVLDTYLEIEEL